MTRSGLCLALSRLAKPPPSGKTIKRHRSRHFDKGTMEAPFLR
jgi:hypothetical protein